MEPTMSELPPIATHESGNAAVKLYATAEDYLFTVTVRGKTASVGYKKTATARVRYDVYQGDPAFFRKMNSTDFYDVEKCVWHCIREAEYKESPF
jgi:hypothetical protein